MKTLSWPELRRVAISVLAILAMVLAMSEPASAQSGSPRPWYLNVRSFCEKHIPMTNGPDNPYWERVLPHVRASALGIKRVGVMARTQWGTSVSVVMTVPPQIMRDIAARGDAAFPGDSTEMSPVQKRTIETRARLQAQALIQTKSNLKSMALFAGAGLLTLSGVPAAGVQAFGTLKKLYKGATLVGAIVAVDQSTQYTGPIPQNTQRTTIDPRRLAQFFYGPARLQRTFSIVTDAEHPSQKWFMTQVSILAADVTKRPVLIPFFSCHYPIKS
ncbi:hypothetical protein [Phaeobacter sp. B1627]|uniref:hypothetical protein n=1 Tax=Phaeobacter sp. B1627 TaxID=2583809 RepID=UPI001118DD52|nr:hypothetical protein [Phaeobacter sp. B1627]TNJ39752.1 hypothetical protein FGE21_18630 [Phaeobacter sp. B1627]